MAKLIDGSGDPIADVTLPGEPVKAPRYGLMGDPHAFTCVSATKLEGFASKAAPDVLKQDVGTIVFQSIEGVKMIGRVIKIQTRTVDEGGRIVGKGKLDLSFGDKFGRSTPNVSITAEGEHWRDDVLGQWKAYRDLNKYPNVLLIPASKATTSSTVED